LVVELADEETGHLFADKGIPVSRNRRIALIYNPSHLLGVEVPTSIVAVARLKHGMGERGPLREKELPRSGLHNVVRTHAGRPAEG
jgi:hypothetical protein